MDIKKTEPEEKPLQYKGELKSGRRPKELLRIEFHAGNARCNAKWRLGSPQGPEKELEKKECHRPDRQNYAGSWRARLHFLAVQPELGRAIEVGRSGLPIRGEFGMKRQQKHE
jgi:hypothetical protein